MVEIESKQVEASHVKVGMYLMMDDAPCKVVNVQQSAPGKHGHKKCRIQGSGLFDGKTRVALATGHDRLQSPIINKRVCQILNISGDMANCMDMETYETMDIPIPPEFKGKYTEGGEAAYWVMGSLKVLREPKS